MKSIVKSASIFLLAVWAGGSVGLAQTNTPPGTNTPPVPAVRIPRFSGKIATVDVQAKTFTLQGATNVQIQVTSQTIIMKDRQPATFDALEAGQQVNGVKRQDPSGKWFALRVSVGQPRLLPGQIPPQPAPRPVPAPPPTPAPTPDAAPK